MTNNLSGLSKKFLDLNGLSYSACLPAEYKYERSVVLLPIVLFYPPTSPRLHYIDHMQKNIVQDTIGIEHHTSSLKMTPPSTSIIILSNCEFIEKGNHEILPNI